MLNTLKLSVVTAVVAGALGVLATPEAEAARRGRRGRRVSHARRHRHGVRRHHISYRFRPSRRTVYYSSVPSTTYVYSAAPTYTVVQPAPTITYAAPNPAYVDPLSDQGIFQAVATMLVTEYPGQVRRLKLKVNRGQVDIGGRVSTQELRDGIGMSIARISGVRGLDNDLELGF